MLRRARRGRGLGGDKCSRSRSQKPQESQIPSDTEAGYRDRPTDHGKHGDAVQAENLSNRNTATSGTAVAVKVGAP